MVGTAAWMAPEVVGGDYGLSADIYSLGVVLWEIFAVQLPSLDAMRTIRRATLRAPTSGANSGALNAEDWLALPATCPVEVQALVRACTAIDARQRPSAAEVHLTLQGILKSLVSLESKLATARRARRC